MRELARIVKIQDIDAIENADMIEEAYIGGWKCVIKKDEFQVGDLAIYFEIDSFLPVREEFEFLRGSSYRENEFMGEGFRIKTVKLRGRVSQGLLVSTELLDGLVSPKEIVEGLDVTELLGVKKWEIAAYESDIGLIIGDKPFGIPTTTEYRGQTFPELINELQGLPYYITQKYEGQSFTAACKGGNIHIMSHHWEVEANNDSKAYKFLKEQGFLSKIEEYCIENNQNLAFQMELCGPRIQGNKLSLPGLAFYIFDVYDIDSMQRFSYDKIMEVAKNLGIPLQGDENSIVKVVEEGESFDMSLEELIELSDSQKYFTGRLCEGIVVRPKEPTVSATYDSRLTIKVLSNKYLLKDED